jgi:hypothetical protein
LGDDAALGDGPVGALSFHATALHKAGPYTIAAEWREARPGLPACTLRSEPVSVPVCAGPAVEADVSVSNESLATLAACNGADAAGRVVLKQLQVQLLDEHGNAARCEGADCRVRCCLPGRSVI